MPRRRLLATLSASATALVTLLVCAPVTLADVFLSPQAGPTRNAQRLETLWWVVFALAVIVFVAVEGALIYSCVKYRARKGAVAAQIHGNTTLEVGWTVGAASILVVLAVVTFALLGGIRNPPNSDPTAYTGAGYGRVNEVSSVISPRTGATYPPNGKALRIAVNGQQYIWRYTYPDNDRNPVNNVYSYVDMYVPTHTTVLLDITSQDVAHSWWIPALGGKFDAVPGYVNHTWFKIEKPGVYSGQCAELCGRNHANMDARVIAVPPAKFAQWLQSKRQQLQQAQAAVAAARKQLGATGSPLTP